MFCTAPIGENMMRKLIIAALLGLVPSFTWAAGQNDSIWDRMIEAIIQVESGGNSRAVSKGGGSVGILQITPICVKECNLILKKKVYSLSDRYNPVKSREMFDLIQNKYNPERNIEKAIRLWNGGPGYSTKKTQGYYNKVRRKM